MNANKTIRYKDNTYAIRYSYFTEKCINGRTFHTIEIYQVNNKDIKPFEYNWETQGKFKSIISQTKEAIKNYLNYIPRVEYSYFEEFQNWNGDLDHWDE